MEGHASLPFINHVRDSFTFVDPTIIQNYHRSGARELIHLVQETTDKCFEPFCIVRAFNDIQGNNTIKRQCWEDRVAMNPSTERPRVIDWVTHRLPQQRKTLFDALRPLTAHA